MNFVARQQDTISIWRSSCYTLDNRRKGKYFTYSRIKPQHKHEFSKKYLISNIFIFELPYFRIALFQSIGCVDYPVMIQRLLLFCLMLAPNFQTTKSEYLLIKLSPNSQVMDRTAPEPIPKPLTLETNSSMPTQGKFGSRKGIFVFWFFGCIKIPQIHRRDSSIWVLNLFIVSEIRLAKQGGYRELPIGKKIIIFQTNKVRISSIFQWSWNFRRLCYCIYFFNRMRKFPII